MFAPVLCALLIGLPAIAQEPAAAPSEKPDSTSDETAATASAEEEQETADGAEEDPGRITVRWDDGLSMETADGRFEMSIGGRLHTDVSYLSDNEPFDGLLGTVDNGLEVRRARFHVDGRLYDRIEYKVDYDFAGGTVGGRDLYVGVLGWPFRARFGHVKEPYSLEELNSSRYITFMERSLANLFAPSRNTGILVAGRIGGDRFVWEAGAFRDTDGFAASTGDNYSISGRFTWNPIRESDSSRLLHLGVAVQHRFVDGVLALSARPGDHNAPKIIEIRIPATGATFVNFEAAANIGALHLQGEYHRVWVSSVDRNDPTLSGFYLQAGYFLTGEVRPFRGGDTAGRVRPRANFLDGGGGAWELAVRYAKIDLSEAVVQTPGKLSDVTLGVNWYWNPHVRWMLNYEIDNLTDADLETLHIVHARLSFDF
jgi:phosphate-selective porin OprO/OprP